MLLRGDVHALDGVGEFVGAGDGLDDDVLVFDAGFFKFGHAAVDEGGDDLFVPARVDDADAECGA